MKEMRNLSIRLSASWRIAQAFGSEAQARRDKSSGQALLIILLIMAVALTIGLSVVSRSVTDIRISQQTEEAARAYSAAEAGIEEALITGSSSGLVTFPETGATYQTDVAGFPPEGTTEFAFPQGVSRDEIQTLWLANNETLAKTYDRDALRVLWGNSGTVSNNGQTPALEVTIYYLDGTYKAGRFTLDPYSGRSPANSFCNPSGSGCSGVSNFTTSVETVGGKNFQFAATLNISSFRGGSKTLLFVRLRLLYSNDSHLLGVKAAGTGTSTLPSQGNKIESSGTAGQAARKVEVVRFHPAPPEIFDFVLYSGVDLKKP